MNLSQLQQEVNKDIDDKLPNADITGWFNRCLDELTPITKKEALTTLAVSSTNEYALPSDLLEIAAVKVDGEIYNFNTWANTLYLEPAIETGEIEIFYYKRLPHLVEAGDIPEIEPSFHDLLILYAVAYSQFMDEELERENDAIMRYRQRRIEYENFIHRNSHIVHQVRII